MATFLLDTGRIVRHLRGQQAYTESIAQRARSLATFLTSVAILPVEEQTCQIFGELSAKLHKQGNHPGDFDTLIAATARQHQLTILTTDADDFSRFEGLTIITAP